MLKFLKTKDAKETETEEEKEMIVNEMIEGEVIDDQVNAMLLVVDHEDRVGDNLLVNYSSKKHA